MTLKPEDHALIARLMAGWPNLMLWGHEGYYRHEDIIEAVQLIGRLAAAREESRPDPRPSPVGREEVARWICRTVRIAQGFKGTAEYTLDDEVHNAWDDWLDEADDLLALFSPADGWRPIETAPKEPRDFGIVLGEPIILGFAPDEEGYTLPSREGYWRPALPRGENGRSYSAGWVSPRDPHVEPPYLQPTHWRPLPAAPPPPGGQG